MGNPELVQKYSIKPCHILLHDCSSEKVLSSSIPSALPQDCDTNALAKKNGLPLDFKKFSDKHQHFISTSLKQEIPHIMDEMIMKNEYQSNLKINKSCPLLKRRCFVLLNDCTSYYVTADSRPNLANSLQNIKTESEHEKNEQTELQIKHISDT